MSSSYHDINPLKEPQLFDLRGLFMSQNLEPQELNEYLDALAKLQTAFSFVGVASKPLESGAAFVWPITLHRDFIGRLTQHSPLSLVLLAHYCVILHRLDGYWFLHGWYRAVLNEIGNLLPLDLQAWIRWPRDVCGLSD